MRSLHGHLPDPTCCTDCSNAITKSSLADEHFVPILLTCMRNKGTLGVFTAPDGVHHLRCTIIAPYAQQHDATFSFRDSHTAFESALACTAQLVRRWTFRLSGAKDRGFAPQSWRRTSGQTPLTPHCLCPPISNDVKSEKTLL